MRALAVLPLLAACSAGVPGTAPGRVQPARAILYENTLTVEMTDRSLCVAPRDGRGRAWSGRLAGCPHLWPYAATLPPARIARLPLTPGEGGPGRAEMTDPSGRVWVFSGPR